MEDICALFLNHQFWRIHMDVDWFGYWLVQKKNTEYTH